LWFAVWFVPGRYALQIRASDAAAVPDLRHQRDSPRD
jgi:hypothetical protein